MRALLVAACVLCVSACGPSSGAGDGDDDGGDPDGGGRDGGGGGGDGGGGGGGGDLTPIDFTNNLTASPMPPGNLAPGDAPMIIVFGWDDCAFTGDHANDATEPDNGMNFIARTFGPLTNPDGTKGAVSFYQNGAYLPNTEQGGPWGSETNLMLAAGRELLTAGFEVGNHTFDHLEINGTWGRIPAAYRMGSLGGWTESVGTLMDQATWKDPVIAVNDRLLVTSYGLSQPKLYGFRAPRLEINDKGLRALAEYGYLYETNMEEGHQWEHVTAATRPGTDQTGFKWTTWPYTLDNGSPGAWQSQDFGEKAYLQDYPRGLWEVPVYMMYVPDNGLQQRIATRMRDEITDEDDSWIGTHIREITAFDFNTFLYARLRKEEWVEIMKWTFLVRYHGNRAPMTFGAHPEEFSRRYDTEVLIQANNRDFLDVLTYNTYRDRKAAVAEFVQWVKTNYPNDVYFLSGKQLVDYMQHPFDKRGNPVAADALATPASADLFTRQATWDVNHDALGSNATVQVIDADEMTIDFTVGRTNEAAMQYPFVDVSSYFPRGSWSNVSHIDIVYEAGAPFRVRLLTEEADNLLHMQVLLAGVGGERKARLRIKDFTPDPYADPAALRTAGFVDAAYMAKVIGLSFESASTKDNTSYQVKIKRLIIHGLGPATGSTRNAPVRPVVERARGHRPASPKGSAAVWPRHEEVGAR